MREFAWGLRSRARFCMATGDIDGAINDIVSCARLGRHLENSDLLLECLSGIACEAMAFGIGAGGSLEHQPTEMQWRLLLDELNHLPERESADAMLEVERLAMHDAIQSVSRGNLNAVNRFHAKLLQERNYGIDWNIVIQRMNGRYDELMSGMSTEPDLSELHSFVSRDRRSYLVAEFISGSFRSTIEQYRNARLRTDCKENMLRIVLAMLIYERQHGKLPPAYSVDEQGHPLHSWRVLLLPYLGYDELHSQIRLDEPWDSAHNQQFHAADVPIFQCPRAAHSRGMTTYSVVEGATCAFDGSEGKRLDSFGPRSAHLVLVVERVDPVCWMDPLHEISFADACTGFNRSRVHGLGSEHEGGIHIGLRSGAVRFISENIDVLNIPRLLEGTMEEPY